MRIKISKKITPQIKIELGIDTETTIPTASELYPVSGSSTVLDHEEIYKTKYFGIKYIQNTRQSLYGTDV